MSYRLRSMKITGAVAMLVLILVMGGCLESGSQPEDTGPEIIDLWDGNGTGDGNPALTIGFGARDYRGPDAFVQWETLELLVGGVSLYTGSDYGQHTQYTSGTKPTAINLLAEGSKGIRLKPQADTDYSALTLDLPKHQCVFTARGHINNDTAVEITVDLGGLVAFIPRGESFRWSAGEDTFIGVLLDAAQLLDAGLAEQLSADSRGSIRISEADNPQMYQKIVERIIRAFSMYNDPNHDGAIDESEQDEGETADSDPFKIKCEFPEKNCTAPDGSFPDRMCINDDVYECSIVRDARGCPIAETYNSLVESCETDTCTRGPGQNRAAYCAQASPDGDIDDNVDTVEEEEEPIIAPSITLIPNILDMGLPLVGATLNKTVSICNSGNALLTVSNIEWETPHSYEWTFDMEFQLPEDVEANSCITISVGYIPSNMDCSSNILRIYSNDSNNPVAELPASVICMQPDGDMEDADEEETETASGPAIKFYPHILDLGFITLGSPASEYLSVCNTGDEVLIVTSMEFDESTSDDWSVEMPTSFPISIAPDSCVEGVTVLYVPVTERCPGTFYTSLVVESNDPNAPRYNLPAEAGCRLDYANPGLELRANFDNCENDAQVDLMYKSPNGISCSERIMNSMHTCNFGDYGAPIVSSFATTCANGTYEEITHLNPADGVYMFCAKMTEDCDQWGLNLSGEEICLNNVDPDFTISLYELVMDNGSPVASSTPIYSVTGNLSNQGDMRCWSLERINGEYPNAPQPLY